MGPGSAPHHFVLRRVRDTRMNRKKPHPVGETGQGLEMSGRRCGSPDIQPNGLFGYSITCTMRRERGSISTVVPFTTV
jgi:hypothetical protein